MPKVMMGKDGSIRLPEEFLQRRRLSECREWWLDQRDGEIVLLPRLPDLRKLYVEPTTDCNLNCRTCIRNVWEDINNHMKMETFRSLNDAKKKLGSLNPVLGIEFVALKSNITELASLTGLASHLGAARVLISNVLVYNDEMQDEILYGYEPRRPFNTGSWPVKADAWVMWGTLDLPRMQWEAEQHCRFVHDRAAVIGWDGGVTPCYALSHNYSYLAIDGRRKHVNRYTLGKITQKSLLEIWTMEEYCRFRNEVRDFNFPSCPDCDLRENCDLREQNEGCWGWNPSCADCLWAQDIIRCP